MSRKQFSIYDLPDTIYQLADLVDDLDSRFSQMQQSMNNQFASQATAITNKFAAQETYINGKFTAQGNQLTTVNNNVSRGAVKSVQRGVFALSVAQAGVWSVTISAVSIGKSILIAENYFGLATTVHNGGISFRLKNATQIEIESFGTDYSLEVGVLFSWQVVEFY